MPQGLYLGKEVDPRTGTLLHVEVVPEGVDRSFEVRPARWA